MYVHVITSASNQGAPTPSQISQQISVLNAAYANSTFSFSHASTDITANDAWYNAAPGTAAELGADPGRLAVAGDHHPGLIRLGLQNRANERIQFRIDQNQMLATFKCLQSQLGGGPDRTRYFHQQVDGVTVGQYSRIVRQYR